jgi:hypothetical protein
MKTTSLIMQEIEQNKKLMRENLIAKRIYNKLAKKNSELNTFLLYLETSPSEIFLKQEKDRLIKLIEAKEMNYAYWSATVCPDDVDVKKRRQLFNKEVGITKLKNQLQSITYLLT